ncbi:unnamed protein product [Clonostachys solani]|uniref:Uncharacterized protein n=1 Tax=Clonostachys solani TaxID=160281 RepID=A0A9N9VZS2_9HYPO|nr:unnamed protein product [Clonostachys solani]
MSNQGYYGHTYTQVQPQRVGNTLSSNSPSSLGNSPYSHGQGGYIPPYHQQADYYRAPAPGFYQTQNEMAGAEGERGLGATVVGGGAAGWAAHKAGSGMLGSLASAAAGAIGANFLESKLKKHRSKKHDKH